MNRKVYLEGEIGEKFGKEFSMPATSFSEVFRCLECNFPEVRKYLIDCEERNIGFVCEVAGTPLNSEAELLLEYKEGDMVISSIPAGSKSGGGKILAAVALIAIAVYAPQLLTYTGKAVGGYAPTVQGSMGAALSGAMGTGVQIATFATLSLGINLGLSGIQQLMAPDPGVDNDQDESYLFQGTGQTLIEGDPVPVLYGKLRIPGRPISVQVRNERLNYIDNGTIYADSTADAVNPNVVTPRGGGVPTNPEETENQVFR